MGVARSSRATSASASATALAPSASVCRRTVVALTTMPVSVVSQNAARAKGTSAPSRASHSSACVLSRLPPSPSASSRGEKPDPTGRTDVVVAHQVGVHATARRYPPSALPAPLQRRLALRAAGPLRCSTSRRGTLGAGCTQFAHDLRMLCGILPRHLRVNLIKGRLRMCLPPLAQLLANLWFLHYPSPCSGCRCSGCRCSGLHCRHETPLSLALASTPFCPSPSHRSLDCKNLTRTPSVSDACNRCNPVVRCWRVCEGLWRSW